MSQDPERFFKPPYSGPSGWLGTRLDVEVDWELLESMIVESYRMIAPKRLGALLDTPREAGSSGPESRRLREDSDA